MNETFQQDLAELHTTDNFWSQRRYHHEVDEPQIGVSVLSTT